MFCHYIAVFQKNIHFFIKRLSASMNIVCIFFVVKTNYCLLLPASLKPPLVVKSGTILVSISATPPPTGVELTWVIFFPFSFSAAIFGHPTAAPLSRNLYFHKHRLFQISKIAFLTALLCACTGQAGYRVGRLIKPHGISNHTKIIFLFIA